MKKTRLTRREVNAIRCWQCGQQVYNLNRFANFIDWLCGSWREALLDRLCNYCHGDLAAILYEDTLEGSEIDRCGKCERKDFESD